uniref:Uncharacterized protein n=1 Tax=Arundo donax TaxID=35708 RepID=A0A0A9HKW3_ARUDO
MQCCAAQQSQTGPKFMSFLICFEIRSIIRCADVEAYLYGY